MSMKEPLSPMPYPSDILALEDFMEITGISPEHLEELVSLGWIEVIRTPAQVQTFHDTDILRVRRLERICGDFELPIIGGTIIVDLLERIDRLERMVRELNNLEGQVE